MQGIMSVHINHKDVLLAWQYMLFCRLMTTLIISWLGQKIDRPKWDVCWITCCFVVARNWDWCAVCPLENAAAEVVVGLQSPGSYPGVSPFKTPCTSKVNDSILGGTFVRWEESTLPWWVLFTVLLVFTAGMHETVEKGTFFLKKKIKKSLVLNPSAVP